MSDIDGSNRTRIASDKDHLYFGPVWSSDGSLLAFLDCLFKQDPGHEWADICVCRPDGSGFRNLTNAQDHWFATSFGTPETRGSGSNMTGWVPGSMMLTYTKVKSNSKSPWEFQPERPDTDHFNCDYKPELARGGSDIYLLNPFDNSSIQLTRNEPLLWDFRVNHSPSGDRILFTRAKVGHSGELWIMDSDGSNQRLLTRGFMNLGADHGSWIKI